MFKVLFPAVFVLSVLLSACGGESTPAVAELALTGKTSVAVGVPESLTAVLRDVSGKSIAGTVTYTSDQPGVIEVDAQGKLTVKRLSATGKPVTVTASAGSQKATLKIATYGLELAVGSYVWSTQPAEVAPGRFIAVRYRPESGSTQASTFTVTIPGGQSEPLQCGLSLNDVNGWCWWSLPIGTKYPAGEYRASLIQNGVTYTTTALVPTSGGTLAFVAAAKATVNARNVTFAGAVPAAGRWIYSYVANERVEASGLIGSRIHAPQRLSSQAEPLAAGNLAVSVYSTVLPAQLQVGAGVPAGTYDTWITAMSGNLSSFAEVLPEQFNVSATFAGQVALK